jgi:endoglucanase
LIGGGRRVRPWNSTLWLGCSIILALSAQLESSANAQPVAASLNRAGINISKPFGSVAFTPSGTYDYDALVRQTAVSGDDLKRLKKLGFDFIRLPVDPGPFLAAPPMLRTQLVASLFDFIAAIRAEGLTVVLDMHPRMTGEWTAADLITSPTGKKTQLYLQLLVEFGARLQPMAGGTALELMNEPPSACSGRPGPNWIDIQRSFYAAVRRSGPDVRIVLSPGCRSAIEGLTDFDLNGFDSNTFVDIHFYEPFIFTHQSAPFAHPPVNVIAGISYPASDGSLSHALSAIAEIAFNNSSTTGSVADHQIAAAASASMQYYLKDRPDRKMIEARFDLIRRWCTEHSVPPRRLLIGEFGAWRLDAGLSSHDDGSRARWVADVRQTAEAAGFSWAYWEYFGNFGIVLDTRARKLDLSLVGALNLKPDSYH